LFLVGRFRKELLTALEYGLGLLFRIGRDELSEGWSFFMYIFSSSVTESGVVVAIGTMNHDSTPTLFMNE
jgi:hypothetical protein